MDLVDPWRDSKTENAPGNATLDPKSQSVRETIAALSNQEDIFAQLAWLTSKEDSNVENYRELLRGVPDINDVHTTGVSLLIYAILFDHPVYIEVLHAHGGLDANAPDTIVGYTPLMWCMHLNRQQCCVELLNFSEQLDFNYKNRNGSTALDLIVPGTPMYEFAEEHELFQVANHDSVHDIFEAPASTILTDDVDHTMDQIDLQTAGLTIDDTEAFKTKDSVEFQPDFSGEIRDESRFFDFDQTLQNQYIEFADYDIPKILDLIVSLPTKLPHRPNVPAAIIFQCIRYADQKKESDSLVESMFRLSLTKIMASASTATGGVLSNETGDVVLQSYWLSALNFLYYYLYRQEGFFKRYPTTLQEIIDDLRTLMVELISSIHTRVLALVDTTILEYTTIAQVKQTLYKKDWNLFKRRKQSHLKGTHTDSYDEILKMLYPPSLEEQMKPSPLKIVQIFGALSYVLDLHQIHPLVAQQCLSLAIKWFSSSLFNKIMSNKKKCLSRAHAVQIRLNISVIQDWIKNHDFTVPPPKMIDDFMWERFPYTLIHNVGEIDLSSKSPDLRNIATYKPLKTDHTEDTSNSLFYYQSFHHISQIHMESLLQLLQWLQVATSLEDEESLDSTLSLLNKLSPLQLLKSIGKYRYEVDESKFNSALKKKLSAMCKNSVDSDQYLPEKVLPLLALPTVAELIDNYSSCEDSYELLPFLPVDVQDDVDEIHEQNFKQRQMEHERTQNEIEDAEKDTDEENDDRAFEDDAGDELFKQLNAPSVAAQKPLWAINSDIEANPW
ncbi:LAFE_0D09824g1_1 [Lachancea fermentati]|uniref:LAFE_0D09824g1_1 n=1 Tax=Lachancea fermentati TaxID=4955 RepID=A0A1G4MBY6_LACFM|nr:LAFE_0D09824g1_1 [Lachancea fermentati]